jgi:hypothetical protein
VDLYSKMNNIAVTKWPNALQEEMCRNFATRMQETQLHDNRSSMFCLCFMAPTKEARSCP